MSQLSPTNSISKSLNNSTSKSSECSSNSNPSDEKSPINYRSPTQMKISSVGSTSTSTHQMTNSSNLSGTIDSHHQISSINSTGLGSMISNEKMNSIFICSSSSSSSSIDETMKKTSNENEEKDQIQLNSLEFIQTDQRRIDHRRNKSEPIHSIEQIQKFDFISTFSSNEQTSIDQSILKTKSPLVVLPSTSSTTSSSPLNKSKESKYPINSDRSSFSSTTNKKKKNWFNPFQSSYRQRNDEFRKIFKDLPSEERLVVDYSCAWQKDILIQGRMYLSSRHLCFHANFLKWETSLILRFDEILSISREKTAKVIPNAIEVRSNKGEKYFFASFATRDKTFSIISKLWESIQNDQLISNEQFWILIHENYGDDLDMTTDEEDHYHQRYSINSTPKKSSPKLDSSTKNPSDQSNCLSLNSIDSTSKTSSKDFKKDFDDQSSFSSRQDFDDEQQISIPTINDQPTTTTTTTTIDHSTQMMKYLNRCPCENHLATQFIDRTYSMSVEHLFNSIFGQNEFVHQYRSSRRIKDFHSDDWIINETTGKRERICRYKVGVAAVFGATTICSNEKQIIDCEMINSHYIIDTEVRNEGIKYADAFFVASRYCLLQISPTKSHLKVTCEVRYVKSLMIIIKSFIEKNATAALQDSYTDLSKRLEQECSNRTKQQNNSSNFYEKDKTNSLNKRKHSRKISTNQINLHFNSQQQQQQQQQEEEEEEEEFIEENIVNQQDNSIEGKISSRTSRWKSSSMINEYFLPFCLLTMFVLLSVNLFLCLKLNEIDRMTDHLIENHPFWSKKYSSSNENDRWNILFQRQEEFYQKKIVDLRSLLIETSSALKNVSQAFEDLSRFTFDSMKTNLSQFHSN